MTFVSASAMQPESTYHPSMPPELALYFRNYWNIRTSIGKKPLSPTRPEPLLQHGPELRRARAVVLLRLGIQHPRGLGAQTQDHRMT